MPIYEYYCPDNHKIYQFLARRLSQGGLTPICPDNPAFTLTKQVSSFAVLKGMKEDPGDDLMAGVDETRLESLMTEIEGKMDSLDSDHPDPRQLGHLMRRMSECIGDRTPPEMKEVIKRLEAGEDPEKLESQFEGLGDEQNATDLFFKQVKKWMHHSRPPARDLQLYELQDWLP